MIHDIIRRKVTDKYTVVDINITGRRSETFESAGTLVLIQLDTCTYSQLGYGDRSKSEMIQIIIIIIVNGVERLIREGHRLLPDTWL